jgi:TonB family protein
MEKINQINHSNPELRPPGLSLWIGVSIFLHFCLTCTLVSPISTRPPKLSWELGTSSIDAYFVQAASSLAWVPLTKQPSLQNLTPEILNTSDSTIAVNTSFADKPFVSFSKTEKSETQSVDLTDSQIETDLNSSLNLNGEVLEDIRIYGEGNAVGSESTINSIAQHGGAGGKSPSALSCPLPRYPKWAREQGITGTVLLDMLVDERGRPQDILIAKSSGYDELDRTARTTAQKEWRFTPAMQENKAVAKRIVVAVQFKLN